MWLDLKNEIAEQFAVLEGCGLPGDVDREGSNVGFSVWDPEKKNAERLEARKDPSFRVRRKASRAKYRETENAGARAYRLANKDEINARRRSAYAARAA